jgi:nicotinamide riboside kinase
MKIAFTGAGGTGKTTLATYVAEKWGIPYVGSVAREVMKDMGVESETAQNEMSEAALFELQHAIYLRRKAKLEEYPHFVTDRLALDNYVYGLRRCGRALTEDARKEWYEGVEADLYSFDLVFYTPTGLFASVDDGIRQTDVAHNTLVDSAIYGLLCKLAFDRMACHVYVLQMADLKRRKDFIDRLAAEVAEVTMGKRSDA